MPLNSESGTVIKLTLDESYSVYQLKIKLISILSLGKDKPAPFIAELRSSSGILGQELTILNDEARLSSITGKLYAFER